MSGTLSTDGRLAFVLIATVLLATGSAISMGHTASAATVTTEPGDAITTDRSNYTGNETIVVSGNVNEAKDLSVTVTITAPSGGRMATADETTDEDTGGFTVAFRP